MLLELLAQHQLAPVHIELKELLAGRLKHHVAGRGGDEAENLGRFHHFEQVGELEVQVARDPIAVVVPAALLERFEQPEHPGELAIRNWIDRLRHQPRSSIREKTLSTMLLKTSA